MSPEGYAPLSTETVAARLAPLPAVAQRLGGGPADWTAAEVGDGNLNFVFILTGPEGQLIAKQALPYVRLVGDSWPLPLERSWFEYNALVRHAARDPGSVPEVYHFDRDQALIVMEFMTGHRILRRDLIDGVEHPGIADFLGRFCARTLFLSSDLGMTAPERKADLAIFAANVALCDITENLVFTDPYWDAPLNRHTSPQLDPLVAELRADAALKVEAQHLKSAFCANAEALLHGDLHTGSVMALGEHAVVIDPEFAVYGPMGFDVGMLISNFLMAYHAQPGHETTPGARAAFGDWILAAASDIWSHFVAEFSALWRSQRTGILYPPKLYEDQGQILASEQALTERLAAIWTDAMGFCGVEMHRRILGLAHNADFEAIADTDRRAACEARSLRLGRQLIRTRRSIRGMDEVCALARRIDEGFA